MGGGSNMMLELLILFTLVAAGIVFLAPDRVAGRLAFALSLIPLGVSLFMFAVFDGSGNALRMGSEIAFQTRVEWVSLGDLYTLNWHVGLDGISMPLLVLSTILTTLAIVSAWTPIDDRQSQFYGLMLFLEAALIGVFAALDFFVWFVFWEAVLIPMYLLIGIWGGPRRKYAAIKFFVYTNLASLVMFIGFVALVFGLGDAVNTLDLTDVALALEVTEPDAAPWIDAATLKAAAFAAMFIGFAVKVPIVPFHTWLPDAHVEAPSPVSVLLAGVLLKMGTYALVRFNFTLLPEQAVEFAEIIAVVAVISVIYGALLALAQTDLKRIVAYSSVSSMGYVIIGLLAFTVYGVGGATFQMIAHGLISGLLFMVVGVVYNQTHTRMVSDMSGIASKMPLTVTAFVAGAFAYMGLPLMAGFAGEFFIFLGSFDSAFLPASHLVTPAAMFGIVIVAGYLLWAMQRTLFGPYELATDYDLEMAPLHDIAPLVVLLGLIVLLGVAPDIAFDMIVDATEPIIPAGGAF